MITENREHTAFNKVSEVLGCQVDGEKLPVKCAVYCFSRAQLLRKVGNGVPLIIDVLLKYGSNSILGCICHDAGWGQRFWVSSVCQCLLDGVKSSRNHVIPCQLNGGVLREAEELVEWLQEPSTVWDEAMVKVDCPQEFS